MSTRQILLLFMVLVITSCSSSKLERELPASELDSPNLHTQAGYKYLNINELEKAERSFTLALGLDNSFIPALNGISEVHLVRENYLLAKEFIDKALDLDNNTTSVVIFHIIEYNLEKNKSEIEKLEKLALENSKLNIVNYYLGIFYQEMGEFEKALFYFQKVEPNYRSINQEFKNIDLIVRLLKNKPIEFRDIIIKPYVTRADLATLISSLFDLDALDKIIDEGSVSETSLLFSDVPENYWAINYIKEVIKYRGGAKLKVRIMQYKNRSDLSFEPGTSLNKYELAFALQELIVLFQKNVTLRTKYICSGNNSIFSDMECHHFAYNAAVLSLKYGLLQVNENGSFTPFAHVSGFEAVMALNKLKEELFQI